jgi:hypothetical protein
MAFKAWVTKWQPIVSIMKPDARTIDQSANLQKFTALKDLLNKRACVSTPHFPAFIARSMSDRNDQYAIAAWSSPAGVKRDMVLIGSLYNATQAVLIACFCPDGIPEMPMAPNPAQMQARIQQAVMQQQLRQVQQAQSTALAQAPLPPTLGMPFSAPGMQTAPFAPGQPGFNASGGMNPGLGLVGNMPAGANIGGLSREMLQSFAMRNADGGNPG